VRRLKALPFFWMSLCLALLPAAGRGATPTAWQILQRSSTATARPLESHTESDVRVIGYRYRGNPPRSPRVHISDDCTDSESKSRYHSAQRLTITGTERIAGGHLISLNSHMIIFSSGETNGNGTTTTFWQRSASTGGKWRQVSGFTQQAAGAAYIAADTCPRGGEPFRVVQGGSLRVTGTAEVAEHLVWNLAGVAQSSPAERFTYAMSVDQITYRLLRDTQTYVEKVQGQVVVRQKSTAIYSRYGVPVRITAPKPGATTP